MLTSSGSFDRANHGGAVLDSNSGFTLTDSSMLSPDAAWIELSRWMAFSERDRARFAPICPDFVIERGSRTDSPTELNAKMQQWIENGAEVAWMIDPADRSVTVYLRDGEVETLVDPSLVAGCGSMAGFSLVMAWVWEAGGPVS